MLQETAFSYRETHLADRVVRVTFTSAAKHDLVIIKLSTDRKDFPTRSSPNFCFRSKICDDTATKKKERSAFLSHFHTHPQPMRLYVTRLSRVFLFVMILTENRCVVFKDDIACISVNMAEATWAVYRFPYRHCDYTYTKIRYRKLYQSNWCFKFSLIFIWTTARLHGDNFNEKCVDSK